MSYKNRLRTLKFCGLALSTIVAFQNCAPSGTSGAGGASSANSVSASQAANSLGASAPNEIDNNKSELALSFPNASVQGAANAQTIEAIGTCDLTQSGAILRWELTDPATAEVVASGDSQCIEGVFQVELAPAQNLACDYTYSLQAHLGLGTPGQATVQRVCAAL